MYYLLLKLEFIDPIQNFFVFNGLNLPLQISE